jgi:hypothetical protein
VRRERRGVRRMGVVYDRWVPRRTGQIHFFYLLA